MESTNNTTLQELNIKMFELMEEVKKEFDNKKGKDSFFYPFRGSNYKGSRSIDDGYFFPGQEYPYVKLYRQGGGHYHLCLIKDSPSEYSSCLGSYENAAKNLSKDFKSYNFKANTRNYLVKKKSWNDLKQTIIQFIFKHQNLFDVHHYKNSYEKNIANLSNITQKVPSSNTIKRAPLSPPIGPVDIPLNLILYGPPGTGKTYNTVNKALEIILGETAYSNLKTKAEQQSHSDPKVERKFFTDEFKRLQDLGQIVFTTFHQSMSYEDFVEGIKPITDANGKLTYKVLPGIFKQICDEAQKATPCINNRSSDKPNLEIDEEEQPVYNYVLIIDEINRGNISQIFGELITLIEEDKRLGKPEAITVKLPYSSTSPDCSKTGHQDEDFGVPKNLYIIGTMNTADRSVEALDTALRRRFSFEEMMPKYDARGMDRLICSNKLCDILWTINQRIEVLKGREQQIGHSYLMKCKDDKDLKNAFKDKIVPLLQEYFYGDYSQIGLVLGGGFVKKAKSSDIKFPKDFESPNLNEVYHLLTDEEWEKMKMDKALIQMKIQPWTNSSVENTNQEGNPQIEQEETKTEDSQEGTSENQS